MELDMHEEQQQPQQRPSRFEQGDEVVVMKFGGTSVEDAAAIRRLIGIVQTSRGAQPVVVVSALARVTDQLLEAGQAAAQGHLGAALAVVRDIYVRHERIADELIDGESYGALDRELRQDFRQLESLLHDLDASRRLDLQSQDLLLGFGECFSSRLVREALCAAGIGATYVDPRSCLITDARHGQASPLWDETNLRIQDTLSPMLAAGQIPVLGGFIAATAAGIPTTLGRGGSDFSAAIFAAALSASRLEIWTDVDGIMTTDPKLCGDARVIRKLSFEEAAELARWGARVLHPATLAPAMRENIPVYVRNSRRPEAEGTEIVARAKAASPVTAITTKRNIAAVEIESLAGIGSELLRAVYSAFDVHGCAVEVLTASPGRMSLLVDSAAALPDLVSDLRGLATVKWENHKALVCLVGENIRRQADIASRALAALSDIKIDSADDVRVVGQDASDRTLSFLVNDSQVEESVQRLHQLLFQEREPVRDWGGLSSAFCQAG